MDSQIPTVDELAEECGVARLTIRQALDQLESDGIIQRFRAKGTFVRKRRPSGTVVRSPHRLVGDAAGAGWGHDRSALGEIRRQADKLCRAGNAGAASIVTCDVGTRAMARPSSSRTSIVDERVSKRIPAEGILDEDGLAVDCRRARLADRSREADVDDWDCRYRNRDAARHFAECAGCLHSARCSRPGTGLWSSSPTGSIAAMS